MPITNINIKIDKSKLLNANESAFVSFPYNEDILKKVKTIPGRRYIPDSREWEIPVDKVDDLKTMLPNENIFIHKKKHDYVIPAGYQFKIEPYDYQIEGIEYGLNSPKFILGDTQGIGKTMQSLHIAAIKKELYLHKHCLIICCVNGLKINWMREVGIHTYLTSHIIGSKLKKNGKMKKTITSKDKMNDIENINEIDDFFLITNVESLRDKEFTAAIKDLILSGEISTIIVDEAHKAKSPKSLVSQSLLELSAAVDNLMVLSGTIVVNDPLDLYMPMSMIGVETRRFYSFQRDYCTFKTIKLKTGARKGQKIEIIEGYKNLSELQMKLKNYMLKRKKEDILNLPDKIFYNEYLEMYPEQEKLYYEAKEYNDENLNIELEENKLALFTRLRQITGAPGIISDKVSESIKLDRMIELIEENIANNQKTIVFSQWAEVIDAAANICKEHNIKTSIVIGPTKDKMAEIDKFRLNDDCPVILGTIASLGTGYSMPEANTIIFIDSPFTDADRQQAIDRAHRLTTQHNITIINLICANTVDERIENIIQNKVEISDFLIEGKLTMKTLEYLLE